jgi:hypothetical protein
MWDGYSDEVVGDYYIDGSECFSGVIKDSVIYTISEKGKLLVFSGGQFVEIARFPIADHKSFTLYGGSTPSIHRNGMNIIDNNIHILINPAPNNYPEDLFENMSAGVWEYTKDTGLYHKYSLSKVINSNVVDYGCPFVYRVGALYTIEESPTADGTHGKFLAGATMYKYNKASGTLNAILAVDRLDTTAKQGFIITPQIYSNEVEDIWQRLYLIIKKLTNATDYISIRYRTDKTERLWEVGAPNSSVGTWTSSTSFTTVSTPTLGKEIRITSGEGSGLNTIVSQLTGSVIMSDTVSNASGTMLFKQTDWVDCGTKFTTQGLKHFSIPVMQPSTWVQFKIIFYGSGNSPELDKLILVSDTKLKAI